MEIAAREATGVEAGILPVGVRVCFLPAVSPVVYLEGDTCGQQLNAAHELDKKSSSYTVVVTLVGARDLWGDERKH